MFTIENIANDIKDLVTKYGAVEGLKACDIKFRDAQVLDLYKEAKVKIAKELANKKDIEKADKKNGYSNS